jgi:hypothetical protein
LSIDHGGLIEDAEAIPSLRNAMIGTPTHKTVEKATPETERIPSIKMREQRKGEASQI